MDTPNHVCNVYSVSWLHIMYHICPIYTHTWYMMMIKMYSQICDIIVIIIIIFIIIIIIIIFILQSGCWLLLSRASVRAGRLSFRVTWSSSILVRTQSRSAPARLPACLHWGSAHGRTEPLRYLTTTFRVDPLSLHCSSKPQVNRSSKIPIRWKQINSSCSLHAVTTVWNEVRVGQACMMSRFPCSAGECIYYETKAYPAAETIQCIWRIVAPVCVTPVSCD